MLNAPCYQIDLDRNPCCGEVIDGYVQNALIYEQLTTVCHHP